PEQIFDATAGRKGSWSGPLGAVLPPGSLGDHRRARGRVRSFVQRMELRVAVVTFRRQTTATLSSILCTNDHRRARGRVRSFVQRMELRVAVVCLRKVSTNGEPKKKKDNARRSAGSILLIHPAAPAGRLGSARPAPC